MLRIAVIFSVGLLLMLSSEFIRAESLDLMKHKDRNEMEMQRILMGVAAYHYWQGDIFSALITIAEARKYSAENDFIPRYRFFEGKVEESFGLSGRAVSSYLEIMNQRPDSHLFNESVLHAASIIGESKGYDASLTLLNQIDDQASRRQRADQQGKRAQYFINLNRLDEAETLLDKPEGRSIWLAYSYYNLAMNLQEDTPQKSIILLDKSLQAVPSEGEGVLIKGQTELAKGYLLLRLGDKDKALRIFSDIGIDSPFLQKALLGYGWVAIKSGRFDDAIRAFSSIDNSSMDSVTILESLLALAYAKEKSGTPSDRLLAYYEFAGNRYEEELHRIDSAQESINGGILSDITKQAAVLLSGNPFSQLDQKVTREVAETLPVVFKDGQVQIIFNEFITLAKLAKNLQSWDTRIAELSEKEDVFWQDFLSRMPHIRYRKLREAKSQQYEQKLVQFRRASEKNDLSLFESRLLLKQQARIKEAKNVYIELMNRPDIGVDQPIAQLLNLEINSVSRRIRMLEGAIRWNIYQEIPQQKWVREKELIRLKKEIKLVSDNSKKMEVTFQGQYRRAKKVHLNRIARLNTASKETKRLLMAIGRYQSSRLETFNSRMMNVLSLHRVMAEKYLLQARLASTRLFQYRDVTTQ